MENSLLEERKLKQMEELLYGIKHLNGNAAELGVYQGGTTRFIAEHLPNKQVYGYDTFELGITDATPEEDVHVNGDFAISFDTVQSYLKNVSNIKLVKGIFPNTAIEDTYAFIHVDADTYQSTRDAINFFWPRMVSGGVLLFDGYDWHKSPGVNKALHEFADKTGVYIETCGRKWNQAYIVKSNYNSNNKKKILITGYNDGMAYIGDIASPIMQEYAKKHGVDFFCNREYATDTNPSWQKAALIRRHLDNYDQVLWIDADSIIMDMDRNIFDTVQFDGITLSRDWEPKWSPFSAGNFIATKATIPIWDKVIAEYAHIYSNKFGHEQSALQEVFASDAKLSQLYSIRPGRFLNAVDAHINSQNNHYDDGDFLIHLTNADHNDVVNKRIRLANQYIARKTEPVTISSTYVLMGDDLAVISAAHTYARLNKTKVYVDKLPEVVNCYTDGLLISGRTKKVITLDTYPLQVDPTRQSVNFLGTFVHMLMPDLQMPVDFEFPEFSVDESSPRFLIQPFSNTAPNPPIEFIQSLVNTFNEKTGQKLYCVGLPNTPKNLTGVDYSLLKNSVPELMKCIQNAKFIFCPRSGCAHIAAGYKTSAFVWLPNDHGVWHLNYPGWNSTQVLYADGTNHAIYKLKEMLEAHSYLYK